MRILAFEPFDSGSHRQVRESISRYSAHEWTWLTRPGRAWKWRMRTASIELVDQAHHDGLLNQHWDLIFTTSLLGAADLRAILPRRTRQVPFVLYMHENQAAYPTGRTQSQHTAAAGGRDVHFALTNLTSILAADRVIWNSRWNLMSFLDGLKDILRRAPDSSLNIESQCNVVEQRSCVIWPPVEPPPWWESDGVVPGDRIAADPIRVVWPHRWEHDKGPDELLSIARELTIPLNLRWTIVGERYQDVPDSLHAFEAEFGPGGADVIDQFGFVAEKPNYWQHLRNCDWVLSTARHEFFGIAVVEALQAGCLPWLPARLSYPELLPVSAQCLSPLQSLDDEAGIIRSIQEHLAPAAAPNATARLDAELTSAGDCAAT